MKKLCFFLFLIFISTQGFAQQSNCEKFKTGKFLYTSKGLPDIVVTRTKTSQTETIKESKEKIEGKIVWKSKCSYDFTITKCPLQKLLGKTMIVEIFDIKGNIAKGKTLFEGVSLNFTIEKLD